MKNDPFSAFGGDWRCHTWRHNTFAFTDGTREDAVEKLVVGLLSAALAAGTGDGIHGYGDTAYAVATHTDHTGVGVDAGALAIGAPGNRQGQQALTAAAAHLARG